MTAQLEVVLYSSPALPELALGPADFRELAHDGVQLGILQPLPLPHDDTVFHGDSTAGARIAEANQALQLSVRREDGDLAAAQQQAAETIDTLCALLAARQAIHGAPGPIRMDAVDVFALDARPAAAAVARLRDPAPQAWVWFGLRPRDDGNVDVESFGLRKLGMPELIVPGVADAHAESLIEQLNGVFHYCCTTGKKLKPGDAISFGWVDVRLVAAEGKHGYPETPQLCAPRYVREVHAARIAGSAAPASALPGVCIVHEPADDHDDAAFVPGVQRAATIDAQLRGAAAQCGLHHGSSVPRANSSAVVCRRVGSCDTTEARRVVPDDATSSGWVAVCRDPDHDHAAADEFDVVPLKQLALWQPRLFPMLAAPPGTGLLVNANSELTVLLPDAPPSTASAMPSAAPSSG